MQWHAPGINCSWMIGRQWGKVIFINQLCYDNSRYTYKTMGAGFYALRNSKEFRKTIMELVMEGGDADTLVTMVTITHVLLLIVMVLLLEP